jgi:hypothetical protein
MNTAAEIVSERGFGRIIREKTVRKADEGASQSDDD